MSSLKKLSFRRDRSQSAGHAEMFYCQPVTGSKEENTESMESAGTSSESTTDLEVFELQLTQLQEQLVNVMIENQELASQLKGYQDKESIEKLHLELEIERKKYLELQQKFSALETKSAREHQQKLRSGVYQSQGASNFESVSPDDTTVAVDLPSKKWRIQTAFDRFWERIIHSVYDAIEDFSEDISGEKTEKSEGDPLTVKSLKENIKRFGKGLGPYLNTCKGIGDLLSWKCPAYTFITFVVYMYAVWTGWLLPLLLFCLTFRLFVTYLQSVGFKFEFNFFETGKDENKEEETLGLSTKFNLVLLVARKVQNGLGYAADQLEKMKSLLTWRTGATKRIFFSLLWMFVMSSIFPSSTLLYMMGLMLGVKLFIIDYFYKKYPRLKQRYDSAYKMWQSLPTDAQYEDECIKTELDKYVLVRAENDDNDTLTLEKLESLSTQNREFCQLFSLTAAEAPLIGWQGGRRCSLINKDKALTNRFKHGKLYLTRSFICFEKKSSPSPENILIPLTDIIKLQKCKPYAVLPGNGMAIEITVKGSKSFIFGGILNRDEAYDHMIAQGMEKMLPWAVDLPFEESKQDSPILRKRSSQNFKNFTMAADYD